MIMSAEQKFRKYLTSAVLLMSYVGALAYLATYMV